MRIAIVSQTFQHGRGYGENVWHEFARASGWESVVIRSRSTGSSFEHSEVLVDSPEADGETRSLGTFDEAKAGLSDFDVTLVLGDAHFASAALDAGLRDMSHRVISFFQLHVGAHRSRFDPLYQRMKRGRQLRAIVRQSDTVVAHTDETVRFMRLAGVRFHKAEVVEWPLPIDPALWAFQGSVPTGDPTLVTAGTYRSGKDELLRSIETETSQVLAERPNARLVTIGFPRFETETFDTRYLALERQSQADLASQLHKADIAIFGQSSILIQQCLASGLAVLVPNVATTRFLLQFGAGMTFDRNQPGSMAGAAKTLVDDIEAIRSGRLERSKEAADQLSIASLAARLRLLPD